MSAPPRESLAFRAWHYLLVPFTLALVLVLWELFVKAKAYPDFFLPPPSRIAARFVEAWGDGLLIRHGAVTLGEALMGFFLALLFALGLGYALAKSPLLEKIISPYLVASQTVPIIALAPLILIWFGTGFWSNAFVGALVCFFPMLVNTVTGIRSIRPEYRQLFRSYAASGMQIFIKLELPAALPVLFAGARVGATLSVIGVTVVELFWADRGLGFMVNVARGQFDTPLLFVTLVALSAIALAMYGALSLLEMLLVRRRRA